MDFRSVLRENEKKTKYVIVTYLIIMAFVGLLLDVVFWAPSQIGLTEALRYFITFEKFPIFTLIIFTITIVGVYAITKLSKKIILKGSEYKLLDKNNIYLSLEEEKIVNMVEEMAISANLRFVPETYIMHSNEMNAFASGWNKDNTLVCITTGLIEKLNRNELLSVIAHEIAHIKNGDSKLTLYVGVLANVILTVVDIFSFLNFNRNNDAASKARIILIILNLILPIFTQILYLFLSRSREYMADSESVRLTGDNEGMISALNKIQDNYFESKGIENLKNETEEIGDKYRKAAYIFSSDSWFSTHPSIENRIKSLKGEK